METLSVTVRYRPVRIGFCVRHGDWAAVRNAWKTCHSFWGGRYNPIVVIDQADQARALVQTFRVDVLWPESDDAQTKAFVESFKHLPNPFMHNESLFVSRGDQEKEPLLLDILHPINSLYDEHFKNNSAPTVSVAIHEWEDKDPLSDVFLVSPGALPSLETAGTDYVKAIEHALRAKRIAIQSNDPYPAGADNEYVLSALGRLNMQRHYSVQTSWNYPGFFFGDSTNFDDLVAFWNLRATDNYVAFYDPAHESRLRNIREKWSEVLRGRPTDRHEDKPRVAIWSRTRDEKRDLSVFGKDLTIPTLEPSAWAGRNLRAPYMYFSEGSALAAIGNDDERPRISFQLPTKPFSNAKDLYFQHMVIAVEPGIGLFGNERATLETPYIPALNEYYGRELYFEWDKARVEPDSFGIISQVNRDDLTLHALDVQDLIHKVFDVAGLKAQSSNPGLIASRLIQQMGGIGRCDVFKVKGVRNLIEKYGPDRAFTRSAANQIIRDHDSAKGVTGFDLYEDIYIEARPRGGKLTPDMCFSYLLKKRMFSAGLEFTCPSCKLDFWIALDHARTDTTCEYCGMEFNVTPSLRDRDWRYRRSGLFGRDNNQEGAIPVLMTIRQLRERHSTNSVLYTTATKVSSGRTSIQECESDFVVLVPNIRDEKLSIAIGECKSRKPIEADDVEKLLRVAKAFPRDQFDVFVVLSKLAPFSEPEIEAARNLNEKYRNRAILLTDRELEPYSLYERTAHEFEIERYASTFAQMAQVTHQIYFSGNPPIKAKT